MKKKKMGTNTDDGSMLTQKTNEDFNNMQPLPVDFKGKKRRPTKNINGAGSATK